MANQKDSLEILLGKGMTFPIELTPQGSVKLESGVTLVKKSLAMLLSFPLGLRLFMEDFGWRGEELLERLALRTTSVLVRDFIIDSVTRFEPRVELLDISVKSTNYGELTITIDYIIKTSGIPDTLVLNLNKADYENI